MSDQEHKFLEIFFGFLNENQVDYTVIRNYETLPCTVSGTDIDLVIRKADFKRIRNQFRSLAETAGYKLWKEFPKNWSIMHLKFAPAVCTDPQEIVKIDFMLNGLKWLGYDLMSRKDLSAHTEERNGVKVLRTPACTLLTLLNSWTYGGKLKEKYRQEYLDLAPDERKWTDQRLFAVFGRYSRQLISGLEKGRLFEPPWSVRLRMIWSRRKESYVIFQGAVSFICGTLCRVISPPGEFVVVIGSDGTGKTSLVDRVEAECVRMYKRLGRFHHYPNLKIFSFLDKQSSVRYTRRLSESTEWGNRQKTFSVTASLFRCCYQLFRYWTGYIFRIYPERVKGSLIVGERWCYDWLIDPQSKGIGLPFWARRMFFSFCPRPDKVIVVRCRPETAEKRKGELPAFEIARQQDLINRLIVPAKKTRVLENDGSLDEGFCLLLNILCE